MGEGNEYRERGGMGWDMREGTEESREGTCEGEERVDMGEEM